MNLFEELNKVLLEDKNKQFIASVEAFTAFDHPQAFYTYGATTKGGRSGYLKAQADEYASEEARSSWLVEYFDTRQKDRDPVLRKEVLSLRMPLAIKNAWGKELDGAVERKLKDIKDNPHKFRSESDREYRDAPLEDLVVGVHSTARNEWHNIPVTRDEFFAVTKYGKNAMFFIGDLMGKPVEPVFTRSSLDSGHSAAPYIIQYVERHVGGHIKTAALLQDYLGLMQEDDDEWESMLYHLDNEMRDEHVVYDGGFEPFILDVISNIEKYAFKEDYTELARHHRGDREAGPASVPEAMKRMAVEPTASAPVTRNLTDLPRHPNDERPTVADLADTAIKIKGHRKRAGRVYNPDHSWIVITGYERSGYSGVKPESRDKEGRPIGPCPYCDGEKYDNSSLDPAGACKECGGTGKDWAWYWASEAQYWSRGVQDKQGSTLLPTPFEKVFRAVWDALKHGSSYGSFEPEAYDGFVRKEPVESDEDDEYQAGQIEEKSDYPVPEMHSFGARERHGQAANTPLFTAVIKCNSSMGSNDRDLWRADYGTSIDNPNQGSFQELSRIIGKSLEEKGLGYQIDPVDNKGGFDKTSGEPLGAAYAIHIWDYVVEPGIRSNLHNMAADQSLEREYLGPDQAPIEQLEQAAKVWEIAKYLDSVKEHKPQLWLALGLSDNANLGMLSKDPIRAGRTHRLNKDFMSKPFPKIPEPINPKIQEPIQTVSFIDQILDVIKELRENGDEKFEGQNRITNELQNVVKQYQKYGNSNRAALPHHIEQLFRAKTALDTMFYSKCLGIPPSWNEDITCDTCDGAGLIGGEQCRMCDGSGSSHSVTRKRGEKGPGGFKSIGRRSKLWERADEIEEIWNKLPEGRLENNRPHYALRMGVGLYWNVPDEYQDFLENKVKKLKEEDEATDLWPETPGHHDSLRLKGATDDLYSNDWRPVRYLETAAGDLKQMIMLAKDPQAEGELTLDDLNKLRTYLGEIEAIVKKATWSLLDPAFKQRVRRALKAAEKWENYGKPEEMIKDRSHNITGKMMPLWVEMKTGTIKDWRANKDCLEVRIFIEIIKLVRDRGSINGMDPHDLWLKHNIYKSFLVVKDTVEIFVMQRAGLSDDQTLDELVYPGTDLPIEALQRVHKVLKDFNEDMEEGAEEDRVKLVERAFRSHG